MSRLIDALSRLLLARKGNAHRKMLARLEARLEQERDDSEERSLAMLADIERKLRKELEDRRP